MRIFNVNNALAIALTLINTIRYITLQFEMINENTI